MVGIVTSRPVELVCIDFLSLEKSKGRYSNLLVITDHFIKYAIAIPTSNQEAKIVTRILVNQFIVYYGIFEPLHSDQGGSFEGKIIKHFCQILGIVKSHTMPWHLVGGWNHREVQQDTDLHVEDP